MTHLVFSADSHINEPKTLWSDGLPTALKDRALRTERKDGYLYMMSGDRPLHRMQLGDGNHGNPRVGGTDVQLRLQDMERDGVTAEIIYPQLGMMTYALEEPDLQIATCQVYNDWCWRHLDPYLDIFVPTAIIPITSVSDSVAELERVAALGFRAVMLPVGLSAGRQYNSPEFDPIWATAARLGLPLSFHIGTGFALIAERGPGAAVFNFYNTMAKGQEILVHMVAGGALDRHPDLKIVIVEGGSSWLQGVCERMDEGYQTHNYYVKPKLSRLPSQIVSEQVKVTFQTDKGALLNRKLLGHQVLLWASDYPHLEGTFPHSRESIATLFDGVEISDEEKADIMGGTAAKLWGLRPQPSSPALAERVA